MDKFAYPKIANRVAHCQTGKASPIPFGLVALSEAALASVGAKALLVAAVVGAWVSLATVFLLALVWIGVAVQL